jgi:hypothetical protein
MTRIREGQTTEPTGLLCDECGQREVNPRGLGAIMARGWWAHFMTSQETHLCGACYRGLEPMAREGFWRRQALFELTDGQP